MKQTIEQWLMEHTKYNNVLSGIDFLDFDLTKFEGKTKQEIISKIAAALAAHIENSKTSH